MKDDVLILGGKSFTNRLLTGTGKFAANTQIPKMLAASGSQMITVALRRIDTTTRSENILDFIPKECDPAAQHLRGAERGAGGSHCPYRP